MGRQKILVVEDQAEILELIHYNLTREGFHVVGAQTGDEGLRLACVESPDLVLLDLMLPGVDGLEVCRRLRADDLTRDVPIIMITAKDDETDVVLGLGVGADDYVTKPFAPKELTARIRAVLRRARRPSAEDGERRIVYGNLVIDAGRHEVRVGGRSVTLTPTEFRLLHVLASHSGRVFTRDQLVSRVIGDRAYVVDRNIDVHVRALRRKLGDECPVIETIRGVGYRFRESRA